MHPDPQDPETAMARYRERAGAAAFDAGFSDRVMARIAHGSTDIAPSWALEQVFLRLAPLAAAAVLAIVSVNLVQTRSTGQPLVDRVLGLPTVTLSSVYSFDTDVTIDGVLSR